MIMANDTAFFAGSHNIKVASFSMLIDVSKHPEDVFFSVQNVPFSRNHSSA